VSLRATLRYRRLLAIVVGLNALVVPALAWVTATVPALTEPQRVGVVLVACWYRWWQAQ
jgi:predicted Na+-dependent transporter